MKKTAIIILATAVIFSLCSCGRTTENEEKHNFINIRSSSKSGGTVEAYMQKPDTLNPLLTNIEVNRNAFMLLYDSLFYIDSNFKVRPALASSYEYSDNADTLTVHLQSGVTWHDGSAFTASDVVYTVNAVLSYAEIYCHNTVDALIENVRAPDNSTVVFYLKQPNSGAAAMLTFPILKYERGNMVNNSAEYSPIGTGAFKLKSYNEESAMVLEKNSDSKIIKANINEVNLNVLPDENAAYSAFSSGITDFVKINQESAGKISLSDSIQYATVYSQNYTFMGINMQNDLLQRGDIRRLIAAAINRANPTESIFGTYASSCDIPINPNSQYYTENENLLTYDDAVKAAKCEYTDSGYAYVDIDGESIFLDFDILVNEENNSRISAAESVKTALGNAGIAANVIAVDFDSYMERLTNGDFDLYIGSTVLSCDMNLRPLIGSGGSLNFGGYSSEKTDSLLNRLIDASGSREDAISKLQADFRENYPHIPLYFKNELIAYNSKKLGNVNPVFSENYFAFLSDCTVNR